MTGYVAKDKDGTLYLYSEEPEKEDDMYLWSDFIRIDDDNSKFNDISFEDKPVKVEIKLEKI
jgi:hypothetical protein